MKNTLLDSFKALGDKTRFKLMRLLLNNEGICVSELAEKVEISTAGVSQQLKVLEQAGLITRVRDGQKICYKISETSEAKPLIKLLQE